jgi:thioredoxin reductase (NADPH)
MTTVVDLAIVGGGPSGLAASIAANRSGLTNVVIEKGAVVDSIRRFPVNMVFFTTPELLEIGDLPLVTSQEKPTRVEALKYYRRVAEHFRLPLHLYEKVNSLRRDNGGFCLETTPRLGPSKTYQAKNVVVATGYYGNPNLLGIPGEDLPKVSHYYTEPHSYFGLEVAVLGGANSAAETALDLYRSGVRVTLIHREAALSSHIKYWVRPDIQNRIQRGEIRALFDTEAEEILPDKIRLKKADGHRMEIPNDFVLAMTGYRPDYPFLESIGIRIEPKLGVPEHDPESMETNVAGLFVAGGIAAGRQANKIFIENGRLHGAQIVKHILSHQTSQPNQQISR